MHNFIKWSVRAVLTALSIDAFVVVADGIGYWSWLTQVINSHPRLALIIRGPFFPILCLGACILIVYGERYLKLPDIRATYLVLKFIPRTGIGGLGLLDEVNAKVLGTPNYKLDCDVLVEVYMVNHSDAPVTIKEFKGALFPDRSVIRVWRWRWERGRGIALLHNPHTSEFQTEVYVPRGPKRVFGHIETNYAELKSLCAELEGVPLLRGHGHRGWLRFEAKDLNREDAENVDVKLVAVDAFDGEHTVLVTKHTGDGKDIRVFARP